MEDPDLLLREFLSSCTEVRAHTIKTLVRDEVREIAVPGDGSCMFHALVEGERDVLDVDRTHEDVRMLVCRWILRNKNTVVNGMTMSQWIFHETGECDLPSYIRQLQRGMWGGAPELMAYSTMNRVKVEVYHRVPNGFERISKFEPRGRCKTIRLLYDDQHYGYLKKTRSRRRDA